MNEYPYIVKSEPDWVHLYYLVGSSPDWLDYKPRKIWKSSKPRKDKAFTLEVPFIDGHQLVLIFKTTWKLDRWKSTYLNCLDYMGFEVWRDDQQIASGEFGVVTTEENEMPMEYVQIGISDGGDELARSVMEALFNADKFGIDQLREMHKEVQHDCRQVNQLCLNFPFN